MRQMWWLSGLAALVVSGAALAADEPGVVRRPASEIPKITPAEKVANGQTPVRVKVLVYEFNPWIPGKVYDPNRADAPRKRLCEIRGWSDPVALAHGYMQDFCDASGGYIQYEIVEWNIVDSFQKKTDGFGYTPESYFAAFRNKKFHDPDGVDYAYELKHFRTAERIDAGEADEVWWFGAPYFGYYESIMIGPDAYWVNAPPMTDFPCKRRFVLMGFNYERGVAEMDHDVGHRTESAMSQYYGGWKVEQLNTNWARWAANEEQSGKGSAGVGTCHYPANAEGGYDYSNPRSVESTADDWLTYPKLTGAKKPVSRENWAGPHKNPDGKPNYHRNYQVWFFTHLPKAPGVNDDGRENNWWKYVYNFNAYDKNGKLLPEAKPVADPAVEKAGATRPS